MAEEFTPQYSFTDDRLNELKQLFPEAFEDGVFNLNTLKELIGEYSTDSSVKEHFGLNWMGKQDARRIAAKAPTGTLKPCPGEGVNEDSTENIFIEGENLEVLKILRKSYMSKIKMIYIDPPYNTGNDFIYNDTFADSTEDYLRKTGEKSDEGLLVSNPKSSGKYHANWLSFMYPRLRLAKDLLKEDGVIYISIDDNELDNLKKICDEIYGEENYRGTIIRCTGTRMGSGNTKISSELDYALIYTKTEKFRFSGLPMELKDLKIYDLEDEKGRYLLRSLRRTGGENRREDRPSMFYPVISPDKEEVFPIAPEGWESRWVCSEDTYKKLLKEGEIEWKKVTKKGIGKWQVYQKHYLGEATKFASNLWNDIEGNKKATRELNEIFDGIKYFDHPKPVDFLKRIINISNVNNDDLILDFFSGSASTGHAAFELESKHVNFILIQLPEICNEKTNAYRDGYLKISDIGKERLKRISSKLKKGFKVYKQNTSTIYKWQEFVPDQDGALPDLFNNLELAYKTPLQDGVITQDFITEVILQEGFPLTSEQVEVVSGIFKITHEWVPYTLYVTMLYSFKDTDFGKLDLQHTDHFVCLDKAFEGNDSLKQQFDNQCKLFTI
ncbi:site-specific DNA-methyltransferase [Eudoraea adriatica]|uniref:site-specific DNA-methyltransferase n=1 Tax=Eudoraea adriatica TaxID=446681 RepID=UPI000370C823|nr:DNA methyltransferase [Eudoraea adriatica]